MALSSTIQPVSQIIESATVSNSPDALLAMVLASLYLANNSKKGLRKLKRKLIWNTLTVKLKSLFSFGKRALSNRELTIIIVVILALLLLTISWQTAVVLLLAGILVALLIKT